MQDNLKKKCKPLTFGMLVYTSNAPEPALLWPSTIRPVAPFQIQR